MALSYPWLGLAIALVLTVCVLAGWLWPRVGRHRGQALDFAAASSFRTLPRFRRLAALRRRWFVVELLALLMAAAGIALLAARPVVIDTQADQRSNRDIVLCLDVSGSMAPVVRDVLDSYANLAATMEGERISLVYFDSAAVAVFPLTDDAGYIEENLARAREEIDGTSVPGTRIDEVGTSLIGDGLASCLLRFDRMDEERSRTVVFATDNQTSGLPLYTLEQAVTTAVGLDVLVFGITPSDNSVRPTEDLATELRRTGGDVLLLGPTAPLSEITGAVAETQARALPGPPRTQAQELLWPGIALSLAGIGLSAVAAHRRRRA